MQVIGPLADKDRIPGIDVALSDKEKWMFGDQEMVVLQTPGHTRGAIYSYAIYSGYENKYFQLKCIMLIIVFQTGHVIYYFPACGTLFTGDTLFSLSCGKLFEGTPEQVGIICYKLLII